MTRRSQAGRGTEDLARNPCGIDGLHCLKMNIDSLHRQRVLPLELSSLSADFACHARIRRLNFIAGHLAGIPIAEYIGFLGWGVFSMCVVRLTWVDSISNIHPSEKKIVH
jgi:hypothetical protein